MSTCQDCKKILPQTTKKYNRRYCDECLFLNRNTSFFSFFNIDVAKFSSKEVEEKVYKEEKIKPYFPPIKNTISLNDYIVAEPEQTDTEHRGKVKKILYRKYCDTCLFHKRNKKFYDRLNIDITKHTRKSL